MAERKCEICGTDMTGRIKSARFCLECASKRQAEQAAEYKLLHKKPKLCGRCGNEIVGRVKYAKLCSDCVKIPKSQVRKERNKRDNPCYGCEHLKYDSYSGKYCNYYFDTGKTRNCDPEDCRKLGKYQKRKKKGADNGLQKAHTDD